LTKHKQRIFGVGFKALLKLGIILTWQSTMPFDRGAAVLVLHKKIDREIGFLPNMEAVDAALRHTFGLP
jgi:hypothetical protein